MIAEACSQGTTIGDGIAIGVMFITIAWVLVAVLRG